MPLVRLDTKNLHFEISPEMGASITKFQDKKTGVDIFRPFPKDKKIIKKNCYFSGYFATVPYFGAIHKKCFFYKNKYISLKKTHSLEPDTIHGEGWVNKWKVFKKTNSSVELLFKHNGKKSFPHKYQVIQKFKLIKNSLIISIKIKNLDKYSFDCGIGFHPWFFINKYSKVYSNSFLYIKNSQKNFDKRVLTKKKFLDLNKYKIDETFLKWSGSSRVQINKNTFLIINNIKNVDNLHIYSPIKEDFFCIEPVTNIRDSFYFKKFSKIRHGLKKIEKGKEFEAAIEFKLNP
ncbi:hypothetical protein OAZ22_01805 [Pelagibacteraceae bacterium]|nr:hypothetical protein [Pelagibacteraceae bacterium]